MALDPKSGAATNYAIPAKSFGIFFCELQILQFFPKILQIKIINRIPDRA